MIKLIKEGEGRHVFLEVCGLRLRITKWERRYRTYMSKREQNKNFCVKRWKEAPALVVFMLPLENCINGGIMSIFSLCRFSREALPGAECVLVSAPGAVPYSRNTLFRNDELIYRWEQLMKALRGRKERTIIHIPEYLSGGFVKMLTEDQISVLKSLPELQINILNQNMELMPPPQSVASLFSLTSHVTQTLAFARNLTQEVADKYSIPTHLFSVCIDTSQYKAVPFAEKEKIIAYSPDECPEKEKVLDCLHHALPDYELRQIQNLSFDEYMALIARAHFVISFGEGFDGYYQQPLDVGSVGLAVYNNVFFPSPAWLELPNVFESYEHMAEQGPRIIRKLVADSREYYNLIDQIQARRRGVYKIVDYTANLRTFYAGEYHIYPQQRGV